MRPALAIAAVVASIALAGCSGPIPSPPLPEPLTDDEVAEILETDADIRWSTLETLVDGAPRPDAEFIAFATPDTWPTAWRSACATRVSIPRTCARAAV